MRGLIEAIGFTETKIQLRIGIVHDDAIESFHVQMPIVDAKDWNKVVSKIKESWDNRPRLTDEQNSLQKELMAKEFTL